MSSSKQKAAITSVIISAILTIIKICAGLLTGSLGIISEAINSTLDLFTSVVSYYAIKMADEPADADHHYGHGKVESLSALGQTVLLMCTSAWVVFEALRSILLSEKTNIIGAQWGILIMLISMVLSIFSIKIMKKAAKDNHSHSLEATVVNNLGDILSSGMVSVGLLLVWVGKHYGIATLQYADSIAAIGVSIVIVKISFKVGKRAINVLLDTAPKGMFDIVEDELEQIEGIEEIREIKIRSSGAYEHIDITVGIDSEHSHREVHDIVEEIVEEIEEAIPRSDVDVSTFPVDITTT